MRKRILCIVAMLILATMTLAACGGGSLPSGNVVGEIPETGYKQITSEKVGVYIPETWKSSTQQGITVYQDAITNNNINIVSTPLVQSLSSLKKSDLKDGYKQLGLDVDIIAFKTVKVDELKVLIVEQEMTMIVKMKQYLFMMENTTTQFTVTLTLVQDDVELATTVLKSITLS